MLCVYESPDRTLPSLYQVRDTAQHTVFHWGFRITDKAAWLEVVREQELTLDYGGVVDYPHSQSWYVVDPTGYGIEVVFWKGDPIRFEATVSSLLP
jgi:catechol-2,3-dioxygenase